jgi:F-type H+-transporting ATPase subunit a
MALFIYILEVVVAFLQAYIFTLLSAMFIGQRYHPEH